MEAEGVSPFDYEDVDCLCRVSRVIANCDRCGAVTVEGAHLGIAFYGIYCHRCCFGCSGEFTLTLEEFHQMAKNREAVRMDGAGKGEAWRRKMADVTRRSELILGCGRSWRWG